MTAVEYLIKELSKSIYFQRVLNEINCNSTTEKDVLKEALELEKQQIINSFVAGISSEDYFYPSLGLTESEVYYNETYKKE